MVMGAVRFVDDNPFPSAHTQEAFAEAITIVSQRNLMIAMPIEQFY